jgi:hypothetical protein
MADKSKMKCNVVRASDRAGKKKMVKACSGGKEKLIHFGQRATDTTTQPLHVSHSRHVTSATRQKIS